MGKGINIMRFRNPLMVQGLVNLCDEVKKHFDKPVTMIEIGCYIGESTTVFRNILKPEIIHCVDMWDVTNKYGKDEISAAEIIFRQLHERCADVMINKSHSRNPLLKFLPKVDFVYIDASHDYDDVKSDIEFYLPLINPGGIIGGHDHSYKFPGVVRAVQERFGEKSIILFGDTSWLVKL